MFVRTALRPIRLMAVAVAVMLTAACDESSPTGPSAGLGQDVVLAPGEVAFVEGTGLRIRFDRVLGDSRCPADAVCILGGDAIVRITVFEGGTTREHDLHTGSMAPVQQNQWTISLTMLSPYPFSGQPIDPAAYRATLRVSR